MKNIFLKGPIPPAFVGESMARHQSKTSIGAHALFLGQVRADEHPEGVVDRIDYTAYEEMALEKVHVIREEAFARWPLTCLHIHHSLGEVKAGEISFFVMTSSPHRAAAFEALRHIVDRIKADVPIWGREILRDGSDIWKQNH
ncbi:MAG: molybdenum cofactor biosynthesis protein MoaE [Saprospiraceae bacterium]|nr:molybdenum cofactor biosynthesis protein MoaE [Saprospiraceae bacterium]